MATYYWTANSTTNWGTAGNWSTTSGGSGDGAVPTNADDVIFDAASPACVVNTSNRVCKTITFTNYSNGTGIAMTFGITVSGNITLGASMVITGTGFLNCNASATLTSNGKTWPNSMTIGAASGNFAWVGNWDINGNLTYGASLTTTHTGAVNINVAGNLQWGGTTSAPTLIMDGTGTLSGTAALVGTGTLQINTAGTITVSGTLNVGQHFTYTAGTVVTTGTTLTSTGNTTQTWTLNGINWENITITNAPTITLGNDLNSVSGTVTLGSGSAVLTLNGNNLNIGGNLTTNTTAAFPGTTKFVMNGTGNFTQSAAGAIGNPIDINTHGTITFVTLIRHTGIMTYVRGTTAGLLVISLPTVGFAHAN